MDIVDKIKKLAALHDAIILAHNYQRDEVQEIADITGDSLELSLRASQTAKKVIVFCGVHFMAESAAILSPEKTVILPRLDAGCPMADMIDVAKLEALKTEHPGAVVVSYVNTSAAVKAHSDICCTSANAVNVVRSITERDIILTPDRNLAAWIRHSYPEKNYYIYPGFCPTHNRVPVEVVRAKKMAYPDALVIAHPECTMDILTIADAVRSTSGMYAFVRESSAKRFIITTESGILYKMRKENPGKEFILATETLVCPNMKKTELVDIRDALEKMNNIISVPDEVRIPARRALDRMLAVPRD